EGAQFLAGLGVPQDRRGEKAAAEDGFPVRAVQQGAAVSRLAGKQLPAGLGVPEVQRVRGANEDLAVRAERHRLPFQGVKVVTRPHVQQPDGIPTPQGEVLPRHPGGRGSVGEGVSPWVVNVWFEADGRRESVERGYPGEGGGCLLPTSPRVPHRQGRPATDKG